MTTSTQTAAPLTARRPKVLSYGGGLDSFAMLLDAIDRHELPDVVCFVDVGDPLGEDPGEWPSTYVHIAEVVKPLCRAYGIRFVTLDGANYPVRGERSLFAWLSARNQIPVAGPNRICTRIAKVERFEAWMADTYPGQDVEVWIGFEAGEEKRAENDPNAGSGKVTLRHNRFPLMEGGFCRCLCEALVRGKGYPIPRKSACTFCRYASKGDWQTLARELPATFAQVAELEAKKPPTSSGKKLSIMGYRTLKNKDGSFKGYRAPPLAQFIEGTYRPRPNPCGVCGAAQRATKATGCDYLAA